MTSLLTTSRRGDTPRGANIAAAGAEHRRATRHSLDVLVPAAIPMLLVIAVATVCRGGPAKRWHGV